MDRNWITKTIYRMTFLGEGAGVELQKEQTESIDNFYPVKLI